MTLKQTLRVHQVRPKRSEPVTFQIIAAQKDLQKRVGPTLGPDLLAQAEAALTLLSANYADWLQAELTELEAARTRMREYGYSLETEREVYTQAHDLRGLGTTFEFPIVTRMASSLCTYLDQTSSPDLTVIGAHVDAIKAAVRTGTRDDCNPETRDHAPD